MLDSLDTLSLWSDIYWFESFQNYLELFQSTPLFVLFIYLFIYLSIHSFIYLFIFARTQIGALKSCHINHRDIVTFTVLPNWIKRMKILNTSFFTSCRDMNYIEESFKSALKISSII